MVDEVARWIELAEERLDGTGIRCYVMPGNDDEFAIDAALESTTIVNPDNRVVRVDEETQMLSCSWTNPTPVGQPPRGVRGRSCSSACTAWPPSSSRA